MNMSLENSFEISFGKEILQKCHPSMNIENLCGPQRDNLQHNINEISQINNETPINNNTEDLLPYGSPPHKSYMFATMDFESIGSNEPRNSSENYHESPLEFQKLNYEDSGMSFNSGPSFVSLPLVSEKESVERRIRSQERNRLAAMKSRQRKKKEWERLVEAEKILLAENEFLRREMNFLRRRIDELEKQTIG